MELHLGADVRGPEDEKLGELRRVVIDTETKEVVSLIVRHGGFDGREMAVPIGAVDSADHDGIVLELSREQFDEMPDFSAVHNLAPPPTADNLEGDENIEPVNVPDVPPVGAATGVESIAFTPVIEEDTRVSVEDDVIDGDMVILATDGEMGRVADLQVDEQTHRITALAVERGLIFKHEVPVPIGYVTSIRPGEIVLNVEKASVTED